MFQAHLIRNHFNSYRPALKGIATTLRTQSNIWVHLPIAALVILVGWYFKVKRLEWLILILTISVVLSAELINTAIEVSLDYLAKEHHVSVGAAKDIAAGGVLIVSVGAAVIGILIFAPYLRHFFS